MLASNRIPFLGAGSAVQDWVYSTVLAGAKLMSRWQDGAIAQRTSDAHILTIDGDGVVTDTSPGSAVHDANGGMVLLSADGTWCYVADAGTGHGYRYHLVAGLWGFVDEGYAGLETNYGALGIANDGTVYQIASRTGGQSKVYRTWGNLLYEDFAQVDGVVGDLFYWNFGQPALGGYHRAIVPNYSATGGGPQNPTKVKVVAWTPTTPASDAASAFTSHGGLTTPGKPSMSNDGTILAIPWSSGGTTVEVDIYTGDGRATWTWQRTITISGLSASGRIPLTLMNDSGTRVCVIVNNAVNEGVYVFNTATGALAANVDPNGTQFVNDAGKGWVMLYI